MKIILFLIFILKGTMVYGTGPQDINILPHLTACLENFFYAKKCLDMGIKKQILISNDTTNNCQVFYYRLKDRIIIKYISDFIDSSIFIYSGDFLKNIKIVSYSRNGNYKGGTNYAIEKNVNGTYSLVTSYPMFSFGKTIDDVEKKLILFCSDDYFNINTSLFKLSELNCFTQNNKSLMEPFFKLNDFPEITKKQFFFNTKLKLSNLKKWIEITNKTSLSKNKTCILKWYYENELYGYRKFKICKFGIEYYIDKSPLKNEQFSYKNYYDNSGLIIKEIRFNNYRKEVRYILYEY
jgi:hypothetical protein